MNRSITSGAGALAAVAALLLSVGCGGGMDQAKMQTMEACGGHPCIENMNKIMIDPKTGKQKMGGDVMAMMQAMNKMGTPQKMKAMAIAEGEKIFNDPNLGGAYKAGMMGGSGQSCASCHPGGGTTGGMVETPMPLADGKPAKLPIPPLFGVGEGFPKFKVPNGAVVTLPTMANNCIEMFMGGQRISHNSTQMRNLVAYLHTLKKP